MLFFLFSNTLYSNSHPIIFVAVNYISVSLCDMYLEFEFGILFTFLVRLKVVHICIVWIENCIAHVHWPHFLESVWYEHRLFCYSLFESCVFMLCTISRDSLPINFSRKQFSNEFSPWQLILNFVLIFDCRILRGFVSSMLCANRQFMPINVTFLWQSL